jgi:hypothetical protein
MHLNVMDHERGVVTNFGWNHATVPSGIRNISSHRSTIVALNSTLPY